MLRKPLAAESEPTPFRFTVKEWSKLGETGLFDEHDRVELLEGEIIIMSPIGGRHNAACACMNEIFVKHTRRRYLVWPGYPVEADNYSEPLPDISLVPRSPKNARRHPLAKDVFLIIEVADSSLNHDRGRKLQKYAKTGVREYWIVNLRLDVIEVYRSLKGGAYLDQAIFKPGDKVSPLAFPDVVLAVEEIIPAR